MRDRLIGAGMDILEEDGALSRVTLRKVAARSGCAHTNAYNYFPSLGALHWAMVDEALERLMAGCLPVAGMDAGAIITTYLEFALDHPALYRLIWTESLDPAAAPEDRGFLTAAPRRFIKAFAMLYPEIAEDALHDAVSTVHALVHGRILFVLTGRMEMPGRAEWIDGVTGEALGLLEARRRNDGGQLKKPGTKRPRSVIESAEPIR